MLATQCCHAGVALYKKARVKYAGLVQVSTHAHMHAIMMHVIMFVSNCGSVCLSVCPPAESVCVCAHARMCYPARNPVLNHEPTGTIKLSRKRGDVSLFSLNSMPIPPNAFPAI